VNFFIVSVSITGDNAADASSQELDSVYLGKFNKQKCGMA
jgi:hypothetical protein